MIPTVRSGNLNSSRLTCSIRRRPTRLQEAMDLPFYVGANSAPASRSMFCWLTMRQRPSWLRWGHATLNWCRSFQVLQLCDAPIPRSSHLLFGTRSPSDVFPVPPKRFNACSKAPDVVEIGLVTLARYLYGPRNRRSAFNLPTRKPLSSQHFNKAI